MDLGSNTVFAIILIAALLLSVLLSLTQHNTYNKATQRMTRAFAGEKNFYLVSGRGKGRIRGALVLLVIDAAEQQVVAAEAMVGATIFARFKGRPELIGPLKGVVERAGEKKLKQAVEYALQQYKVVRRAKPAPIAES